MAIGSKPDLSPARDRPRLMKTIEELKGAISTGLAQLRRGEGVDGAEFFRSLDSRRRGR